MVLQQILTSFSATLGFYVFYKLLKVIYDRWTSPLNFLPGPPSSSFVYGNMKEIWDAEPSVVHEKWIEKYGSTMKYNSCFGTNCLFTIDLKAINHILMNDYAYQKPEPARYRLSQLVGNGLLIVEEGRHKQQRKVMNPAFGVAQIRDLTEIFVEKSIILRDIWAENLSEENGTGRVEVLSWLSKLTLDIIGLAGFKCDLQTLTDNPKSMELNEAFRTILRSATEMSLICSIKTLVPVLRWLPAEQDAEIKAAFTTMARIGDDLIRNSKMGLIANDGEVNVEKTTLERRNLLSLLIKANISTNLPLSQCLTDEDVVAQIPTFLLAGHETTSTAIAWALFALTQNLDIQKKLRYELLTVSTDNPTMDELNALTYLDAVVRESLRIHPPVPSTMRTATQDDLLPLYKAVKDKDGNMIDRIIIRKGQMFCIPILTLNQSKELWGEDAAEFKPERWKQVPEAVRSIPGIWGNMMTFLGGPRACIGYRFSLVEIKALLFTLIRVFEFELDADPSDLGKKSDIVQRPVLKSNIKAGNQMPLTLKLVNPML